MGGRQSIGRLFDLAGQTAVVTGASGGIGSAIAALLAQAGASVVVHYHSNAEKAGETVDLINEGGGRAVAARADLADEKGAAELLRAAGDAFGSVGILVNNVGEYKPTSLVNGTASSFDEDFETNLLPAVLCTRAAVPFMKKAGGAIVNMASLSALHPAPGQIGYVSAKAALVAFTRAAAQELGPLGIRVNAISPGLVSRPSLATDWPEGLRRFTERAPLGRVGTADDVANACLFLVSPAAAWISGHNLVLDGGISSIGLY